MKKHTYPFPIMEASWDPTLHPTLCTWYLHKEEGSKPLPQLHLCLTAEVPAGQGTGLDAAKGPAEQGTPCPFPQPRFLGQAQI